MQRHRILIVNVLLLIMVAGVFWSRHLDSINLKGPDLLKSANLDYDGWTTSDVPISAADMHLLSPDMSMVRNYAGPDGKSLQFAVIAGHRKRSIHTPSFCMVGGGWQVISQASKTLAIDGANIPVTQSILSLNGNSIMMTYYFTDGEYRSSSLVPFQFVQLMKRFENTVTIGALVRVIVPYHAGNSASQDQTTDFLSKVSPKIDGILRSARVRVD